MKICPKCNRSFDDSFSFCLEDGAVLSPSGDAGETRQFSAKSKAQTEVFPVKIQDFENKSSEKQSGKNVWKWAFVLMTIVFIIGLSAAAFLLFNPFDPEDKAQNQKRSNGIERPSPVQSNKNANVAALNRTDNSQNAARSNSSANVKTNSADSVSSNENSGKPIENVVGSVPPKLKQGMPYAEARKMLIQNGWQAATFPPNRELFGNMDYVSNTLGFYEVEDCSGTGLGFCRFLFRNHQGKKLVVVTVNNEEDAPGGGPSVSSWSLEEQ